MSGDNRECSAIGGERGGKDVVAERGIDQTDAKRLSSRHEDSE